MEHIFAGKINWGTVSLSYDLGRSKVNQEALSVTTIMAHCLQHAFEIMFDKQCALLKAMCYVINK